MKKYFYIGVAFAVLIVIITIQQRSIQRVKADRDVYKSNTEALLTENEHYKVRDSLNAVSTQSLTLKLSEYEKYRTEDATLISELRADNRRLNSITSAQIETINHLRIALKDSIVYIDGKPTDVKCIEYSDQWLDFNGCFDGNKPADVYHASRMSLKIVNHYIPKKFLGFLWKTKKVKELRVEAITLNPNSTITDIEHVIIRE